MRRWSVPHRVALVFPSLYLLPRTRWYPYVRVTGAVIALVAAVTWSADRLGRLTDPLAGVEQTLVDHPWWVVLAMAALALLGRATDRRTDRGVAAGHASGQPLPEPVVRQRVH